MSAREALRIARATIRCSGDARRGCAFWDNMGMEWAWIHSLDAEDTEAAHGPAASALLDGFSVAEVTRAGG